jgi:hypothetical protein
MKITDEILDELGFEKKETVGLSYFYELMISDTEEFAPIYLITKELSDEIEGFWTILLCDDISISWVDATRLKEFVKNIRYACSRK